MPTFIKTGFWEKVKRAPKEWLNLDKFVEDKINANPPNLGYKVYSALLTQENTNPPSDIVLQNTIGSVYWTYEEAGTYYLNSNGLFTENKVLIFITSPANRNILDYDNAFKQGYQTTWLNENQIEIISYFNTNAIDNYLLNTSFEIRVYP